MEEGEGRGGQYPPNADKKSSISRAAPSTGRSDGAGGGASMVQQLGKDN